MIDTALHEEAISLTRDLVRVDSSNPPGNDVNRGAADTPPRTLQQFLSLADWDQRRLVDRLQELVASDHTSTHAVGKT